MQQRRLHNVHHAAYCIDDPVAWCLSVTQLRCTKTTERIEIEVPFGMES